MSIGYIDILQSGNISGTTIFGETLIVNNLTASTVFITGSSSSSFLSLSASSFSANTIQSNNLTGATTQMVIANASGILSTQAIPSAGQSTIIRNGINTYTAGTATDYTVNVSALTINTLSASGSSVFTGGLSANTFSASTINSGSTDLYSIFAPIGSGGSSVSIQNGLNTYTGGTALYPTVNLSSLTINTLTTSGASIFNGANTFNGPTTFTGITNVNGSMNFASNLKITYQSTTPQISNANTSAGLNFDLNNHLSLHTNNLHRIFISSGGGVFIGYTPNFTEQENFFVSGNSVFIGGVSANTFSASTINSGSTDLYSIFAPIGSGGENNTASNLGSGTGIFAQKSGVDLQFKSLSAGTNIVISSNSDTIVINSTSGPGGTTTNVQPGTNTYTGGTDINPTVNVSALTINTIIASGSSVFNGGLSANTLFSGTTNLGNIFSSTGHTHIGGIGFSIDANGNNSISTGIKGSVMVPFDCIIQSWTILSDVSGSTSIDVWSDMYGNYPSTSGDTITGTEKITLTNQQKNQDLTLTSWTTSLNLGSILTFNVESVSSLKKVYVMINVIKLN